MSATAPDPTRTQAHAALPDGRMDLRGLDRRALVALAAPLGRPEHHARKVFKWAWQKDTRDLMEVEGITKAARAWFVERLDLPRLESAGRFPSADGTIKYLWRLHDGHTIESVLIPDEDRPGPNPPRYTLCVSTQVGCAMACTFCLTGDLGLKRNLTAGEIARQPLQVLADMPEGRRITNIVLMGMGEPLHNYDNLTTALRIWLDDEGLNLSHRRITVSTVGLVPRLVRLAHELPVNIAISLNATTEEQRRQVMPITSKYSLQELMDACRALPLHGKKRITFEYVMMAGFNATLEDAARIEALVEGIPAKVNLIPYNENPDRDIRRPSDDDVRAFQHHLVSRGVHCSVRTTRGRDVNAACGQLGKAAERMARRVGALAADAGDAPPA
jgi:23S rRNA (adenine2503-C2)-methyltransferase